MDWTLVARVKPRATRTPAPARRGWVISANLIPLRLTRFDRSTLPDEEADACVIAFGCDDILGTGGRFAALGFAPLAMSSGH
ncbi:MAG: hypothetical protein ACK4Y4_12540, partial [Brevundimonas sp.]